MESIIFLVIVMVVIFGGYFLKNKLEKHMLREQTAEVTVEQMEKDGDTCRICYRKPDGKTVVLRVPQGEYDRTVVGETGQLSWIKGAFVDFDSEDPTRKFRG